MERKSLLGLTQTVDRSVTRKASVTGLSTVSDGLASHDRMMRQLINGIVINLRQLLTAQRGPRKHTNLLIRDVNKPKKTIIINAFAEQTNRPLITIATTG